MHEVLLSRAKDFASIFFQLYRLQWDYTRTAETDMSEFLGLRKDEFLGLAVRGLSQSPF
jgi:hypothetical protein